VAGRDERRVTLRLPRQQLADILGVAKETAVRALATLKQQGLVSSKGQAIIIHDLEALPRKTTASETEALYPL
jgi:CRP-like cAMP-binding protein